MKKTKFKIIFNLGIGYFVQRKGESAFKKRAQLLLPFCKISWEK